MSHDAAAVELQRMDQGDNEDDTASMRGGYAAVLSSARLHDDAAEDLDRRTLRKLDFVLLPFLALLFLFNSLDRSNVSFESTLLYFTY